MSLIYMNLKSNSIDVGFIPIKVFYDPDKNTHSLELEFNIPIVGDQLIYHNPDRKPEGWEIEEGSKSHLIDDLPIQKGGCPSKKLTG